MHGNKCLLAGTVSVITSVLFMRTTAAVLILYIWEQLWKIWHYIHGNNCGNSGTLQGNKCGKSGTIYMGTSVVSLALYTWEQL
jgi:hypothetical protein